MHLAVLYRNSIEFFWRTRVSRSLFTMILPLRILLIIMMIHAIKSTIDWSQARRTTCALPDDHHRDLGWPVVRSGIAAFADHG
jgi:hypothetical protein